MDIPRELKKAMESQIRIRINKIYLSVFEEDEIDTIIKNTIEKIMDNLVNIVDIDKEALSLVSDRIQKTKRRWIKREEEANVGFAKEIDLAKQLFKMVDDEKKFKITFEVDNPDELIELRKEEMEEWKNDRDRLLGEFIYIKSKHLSQIQAAIKNDIECLSYKYIKDNISHYNSLKISEMPHTIQAIPVDYTNKSLIGDGINPETIGVQKENEQYFVNKYYIGESTIFESVVDAQILKTGTLRNAVKMLNTYDRRILLYLLSSRDELSFCSTREVIVSIGDIVKNCFQSQGAKNYLRAKESLFKMQYLTTGVIDDELKGFTIKILDNVEIYNINGREDARVIFNIDIVNDFVNRKTTSMYKDVIDRFKLPASEILIFKLQKERISLHSKRANPMSIKVNLSFFRSCLFFSNKQKVRNIEIVENSLKEIVDSKITLKSYKRKGDVFELEFYPFTEKEELDLLHVSPKDASIEGDIIEINNNEIKLLEQINS